MAGSYVRSVEESKLVIKHAKLDEGELKPLTQPLFFSEHPELVDSYKFLELDTHLLNTLHEEDRLTFRGLKDEPVVLCTETKTFEVKEAETSNSLLLVPSLTWPAESGTEGDRYLKKTEVCGIFHKYLELKSCLPRFHNLKKLLEETKYSGPELEEEPEGRDPPGYTFQELLDQVQSSEVELHDALEQNMVCNIKGKWRILDPEYHFRVLSFILGVVDENSWPPEEIKKKVVCDSLSELAPADIVEQCFSWYTDCTEKEADDGEPLYKLKERKVCRYLAEVLLRTAKRFKMEDFLTTWENSVPEGLLPRMSHLDGLVMIEKTSNVEYIVYYPETDLPTNIAERFTVLFSMREKWTFDEIRPFVERLVVDKMNVGALLTKYARISRQNGITCYTAKHAK